jgi:hypothetical protein
MDYINGFDGKILELNGSSSTAMLNYQRGFELSLMWSTK